ncbi:MAG TPA: SLC13 family permease [Woeseiaceae bacterium]|nr:SLC13 family permease [Woeseiaceae bacterium]
MDVSVSPHAILAIVLACAAIFLYTREKIPLESSSLAILAFVLLWFELFEIEANGERVRAGDFLAGFGNEALLTVISLIVLTRGLEVTQALQPVGIVLARLWRVRPQFAFLLTMLIAATLSMFLNNTPVVAALMPLLLVVSLQVNVAPSRVLMPIGFATIIGGMATTIGTSTNLLVVSIAHDMGLPEMSMFHFAPPVLFVGAFAILYLWLAAPKLLPDRTPPMRNVAPRLFDSRLRINDSSEFAGAPLAETLARTGGRMRVSRLMRGNLELARLPSQVVQPGDYLHVNDTLENLVEFARLIGATVLPVGDDRPVDTENPLASREHLAELVVMRGSPLEQTTLAASRLLSRYGLSLLALHRPELDTKAEPENLKNMPLRAGDVIVLQGAAAGLERLKRSGMALVLDGNISLPRPAKATLAFAIMLGVVLTAATGLLRISQAAFVGVGLMLLTRCFGWQDVRDSLDRGIILVIVASLALGLAMTATGAADLVAHAYVAVLGDMPVWVALSGLILVMALLTEVATNNAVAVLGTPIAIGIAQALDAPAEPFVLAVLYGANMSYMTPVGYQTNLLVMNAGGYRFSDFLRAGVPLQLIMWIGLSAIMPIIYDL